MGSSHKLKVNEGDVFGNLTVIKEVEQRGNSRRFLFLCKCGNQTTVSLGQAKGLFIKSCGCMKVNPANTRTHGMTGTKLYSVWRDMKNRCLRPKTTGYHNYGGRGITVFEEWLRFEPFMQWAIASGYQDGLSIERVKNNLGYNPSNCIWIPKADQNKNKRNVNMVTYMGETLSLAEWSRKLNVPIGRVIARKKYGWDLVKALTVPLNPKKRKVNYAT